ncbi:MAG: tetratricopeptide repeat protein [Gammaproteobacteria bacterium]
MNTKKTLSTLMKTNLLEMLSSGQIPLAALGLTLLSACATTVPQGDSTVAANSSVTEAQTSDKVVEVVPQPLPEPVEIQYGNFDEDVLTRVIIAEMAGQRGYNQKALEDYLALARETNDINIIRRASRIASFMRDVPAAIETSNLWLAKEPESQEALRTLAFQMATLGRYREAMTHMRKLLALGYNIDFRLITNRTAVDNDAELFLDALIADLQELKTLYPENQSVKLGLAHLHHQNSQAEEAYMEVSTLTDALNDNPEVVLLEVELLEILERPEQARERLQEALKNNSNHKELRFQYARKLIDDQRYSDARDQFAIIVEQYPDDYDMLYSLALLSMEINLFSEARQYFEIMVENAQRLDDAHYYLGFISVQENKNDEAIKHFFNVNGGGNFLQAQRSLTELMIRAGRYREVRSRLQNVRFRNPDYNIALLSMEANVLMDEGQRDEAGSVLNNAVGAFPNNIQLLFLRSVYSQEINDLALMEEDLRRIIQLNPNNPVAYNSLGYTLADRTDRFNEAYELIKRAFELAPNDAAIIDSLGWVQYRLGMYEEAIENLDRAYELFPDHEVAAHLGEVLWVTGERTQARSIWRKALESQPNSEFIRSTMERLTSD